MRNPGDIVRVGRYRGTVAIARRCPGIRGLAVIYAMERIELAVLMGVIAVVMRNIPTGMRVQLQAGNSRRSNRARQQAQQQPAMPTTGGIESEAPHVARMP